MYNVYLKISRFYLDIFGYTLLSETISDSRRKEIYIFINLECKSS
nr:MAG TPA: hypothetical protein [Caudoviricetes sp.]